MRQVVDLNGEWRFVADLDPEYHSAFEYKHPDWDRQHWEVVRVPGCWNLYADRYRLFEGVAWFAKEFELSELPETPVAVLRFGAVNYLAHVFLNGEPVGCHEGGYTEFSFDVTAHVRKGRNVLVVRVNDRHSTIKFPPVLGWFNYGGIHRSVSLEVADSCRIDRVLIDASPDGSICTRFSVGPALSHQLLCTISDPEGNVVLETEIEPQPEVEQALEVESPARWAPATPDVYTCTLQATDPAGNVLDRVETTFGFRQLRAEGRDLLLNDEKVFLKGLCHLCICPETGIAFDRDLFARDLADMSELGANALRCHFPMDERALDACDRAGMMVWLEVPVYCIDVPKDARGTVFADEDHRRLAKQMVEEMIVQAYNHPSVVIWSVGNECDTEHPEARDFFTELVATARRLDPHRLLSYASLYGRAGCLAELVDVIGINQYWGWYDRCHNLPDRDQHPAPGAELDMSGLREGLERFFALVGEKPAIMSEFGADAAPGYRDPDCKLWTEDYQARLLESTYQTLDEYPPLAGTFPFSYSDYPDPSKLVQRYWHGINLKGVVGYDRSRKLAFDTLRRIYERKESP